MKNSDIIQKVSKTYLYDIAVFHFLYKDITDRTDIQSPYPSESHISPGVLRVTPGTGAFVFTVVSQHGKIQSGKVDPFFLRGFQHAGIPGIWFIREIDHTIKKRRMSVAVRMWSRIVAGSDGEHIFISPSTQLGKPVDLHRAGIWNKEQFCTF